MHTSQGSTALTVSKDGAHHLNTALTSLKFVLIAQACDKSLGVIQHLSKVLEYDSVTTDGVTRKFAAAKERLQNMLSATGSAISKEAQSLREDAQRVF